MIGVGVNVRTITSGRIQSFKNSFFDRQSVIDRAGKAKVKVLSKMGAFVRQRDRSSIRKRKRISDPGSPPSSHKGDLKRWILFAYDSTNDSVVVGAAKFRRGNVPEIIEKGGVSVVTRKLYKPRPHTFPAYQKELPKFTPLWRDSIKK